MEPIKLIRPVFETLAINRLWDAADIENRTTRAKDRPENQFPPLPPEQKKAMEEMLADPVGDVVYGIAVSHESLFVRTSDELICVRQGATARTVLPPPE